MNPGRNFDIIISGERGAYRLAAVRPDGTRLPDFPLKLGVGDAFQQLLVKRDAATMIAVGERLYNALFSREIYGAFKACQAEGELRIRLSIRPPELAVLPWELLYDPQGREFLVTTNERPLVRTLDTGETPLPMSVEGPLRGDLLGSLVEGKSVRLVYLAACETAQAAESDPLAGVA